MQTHTQPRTLYSHDAAYNPLSLALSLRLSQVSAAVCSIPAVIVVNKLDLETGGVFESIKKTYGGAGYRVIGTSAKSGEGVEELRQVLGGGVISALYGLSGSGKSSLINCLGGLDIVTREVSERIKGGRHTTSASNVRPNVIMHACEGTDCAM